jgi:uncharacterized membrane protein YidH (DUF202 family)
MSTTGVQIERTALAWKRTTLALAGGCGVLVHANERAGLLDGALAALLALNALAAVACAELRYRAVLRDLRNGHPAAPPVTLVAGLASSTTLTGLTAFLLLVT